MQAIMIQTKEELKRFNVKEKSLQSLFIGGGTPSCIEPKAYKPFMDLLRPYFKDNIEITSEANPNSATYDWIEGMFALGVNRLSFGVQSFDSQKLHALNRNHTPSQAKEAIQNAHKIGFKNISLDLIYGSSFDSEVLLLKDIETAFTLPINHLSAYSLTIEEGTKFFDTPEVSNDDEKRAFWFVKEIEKRGLPSYEISNFGHYQSVHNRGYWEYKDYLGIGAGAVGFLKTQRFYTLKDVEAYIKAPLYHDSEQLKKEDILHEKILLGLRSNVGFEKDILSDVAQTKAQHLIEADKLHYHDKRYYNPNYFLADELALYITS